MSRFLRDLEGTQHLFDSDVSYFLVSASAITTSCKTVVLSREHSRILDLGLIPKQNYSVLKPPPVDDRFVKLYADLRADIAAGTITSLTANDLPATAPDPPDHHILAPDRIMQLDMKLRNNLLSLITARGRQRHYQELTMSGCALLLQFAEDAKSAISAYVQSPHIRRLKAQLEEVKKLRMTCLLYTSPSPRD